MTQPVLYKFALLLAPIIVIVMYLEIIEVAPISQRINQESISRLRTIPKDFDDIMSSMPSKRTSKWIVITSTRGPTDNVKRLASHPDWTLVVVGEENTPEERILPDVHHLSLVTQAAMGFDSLEGLPRSSYSRKNAGYLYSIANGANWIYDTDDDIEFHGKGLDQFEYVTERTRGLRFTTPDWSNTTIQESMFNPYRHFGRPEMWPRGFPIEHIKNHDHKDGSYRLCRVQQPPAVQQAIVQNEPEVDAIYRIFHSERSYGLEENFSEYAPPVILAPGTYAPLNSRNTLFSRSAFFCLFLPTTVSSRVADIWRGYFMQALLHAAGETVSFVPVNAIRQNKAKNVIKDFNDEMYIFDKAGEIVQFIDEWMCKEASMEKCMIELAEKFAERGFWNDEDAKLVKHWVYDLQKIGYVFPALRKGSQSDYLIGEDKDVLSNCSENTECYYIFGRAHLSLVHDLSLNKTEPAVNRAVQKINNFGDLKDWCNQSSSEKSKNWLFPAPDQLAEATAKNKTLTDNYQTVAIISNNYQWSMGMGMLQRMYEANFAMLIFCGHYPKQGKYSEKKAFPDGMAGGDWSYPNLKRPINYIDLSNEEVQNGFFMYYCLTKVEEMNIQNVKGYVIFSDDATFNFWNPLNLDLLQGIHRGEITEGYWWKHPQVGFNAMRKTIQLMSGKYKNDSDVVRFVGELKHEFGRKSHIDPYKKKQVNDPMEYLMVGDGWVNGDWLYVPTANISFVAMFAQLAHEGGLFHEIFVSKLMYILPSEGAGDTEQIRVDFLWGDDRAKWSKTYSEHKHGLHPIKLSEFQKLPSRAKFCDMILDKFYHNIFRICNLT